MTWDTVVVGGGIAGLGAAAVLARGGRKTLVLEKAAETGGRAATTLKDGFALNIGPHALYRRGALQRLLTDLGVTVAGTAPASRGLGLLGEEQHALPGTADALVSTALLSPTDKLRLVRLMARVYTCDPHTFDRVSVTAWLDELRLRGRLRAMVLALVRVSTYANDPDEMSAGAAVAQLQLSRGGVRYLDGGWTTIVSGLRAAAEAAGAIVRTHAAVVAIDGAAPELRLTLADGSQVTAASAVLTGGLGEIAALVGAAGPWRRILPRSGAVPSRCRPSTGSSGPRASRRPRTSCGPAPVPPHRG